jgi:hypothetical protein
MMIALGADQPAVGELVHRVDALISLPGGKPCARRAGQCLGASLDRCRRWRLPSDDDDPRHLTETVDAGHRAVGQPFDVARQRADGLGLDELVAVAIEMDELPAGDLPAGIGGDGDQGVAAGVIAYREVPDAMARVWTDGSP